MIGRTLSHFKITAKLGEGGIGEVYRTTSGRYRQSVFLGGRRLEQVIPGIVLCLLLAAHVGAGDPVRAQANPSKVADLDIWGSIATALS